MKQTISYDYIPPIKLKDLDGQLNILIQTARTEFYSQEGTLLKKPIDCLIMNSDTCIHLLHIDQKINERNIKQYYFANCPIAINESYEFGEVKIIYYNN